MPSTLELLQAGADLHGELCQVLQRERVALVQQTVGDLEEANRQRETLLSRLADWSNLAQGQLTALEGEWDGAPSLSDLVAGLPGSQQGTGAESLVRLRTRAEEAQALAATNHILVSRNMDLVSRTLAFYTGGTAAATYTAKGAVTDDPGQPVVEANG